MGFLVLLLLVGGAISYGKLSKRVRALELQLDGLIHESEVAARPLPDVAATAVADDAAPAIEAPVEHAIQGEPTPDSAPISYTPAAVQPEPDPARSPLSFEQLVGGRLPIWAGGAALAIAGFFLVSYAIEIGLLTPLVRVALASLFGVALIAAGEAAGRLPLISDDPRVGQSLSGAGIATLYASAWLSSGYYALLSPFAGFVLMAAITAAALGLALRRGAPTAVMGLLGGFSTPLLSGLDSGGVWPVLIYLALLIAGLFALAIRQGWLWLAILAAAGGFGWSLTLIVTTVGGQPIAVGLFVLALAAASVGAMPSTTARDARAAMAIRMLPLAVGLVQLGIILPRTGFGLPGWSLYLTLSVGCIWLSMREPRMTVLTLGALLISLAALAGMPVRAELALALYATAAVTIIFAGAGHMFARREIDGRIWAVLGAVALIVPPALLRLHHPHLLADGGWAVVALILALPALHLAWRSRGEGRIEPPLDMALQLAAGSAALLVAGALADLLPLKLLGSGWLVVALLLGLAARRIADRGLGIQSLVAAIAAACAWVSSPDALELLAPLFVPPAPTAAPIAVAAGLLMPALLLAALFVVRRGAREATAYANIAAVALLAAVAAPTPADYRPLLLAAALLPLVEAARLVSELRRFIPVAAVLVLLWMLWGSGSLLTGLLRGLGGDPLILPLLPSPLQSVRTLMLPAVPLGYALWRADFLAAKIRGILLGAAAAGAAACVYVLLKQPFAIRDETDFMARGFAERMIFTQLLFGAGAALAGRAALRPWFARAGLLLTGIAAARLIWLDLLVYNPALRPQMVGAIPLLNLLTLHFGLAVLWLGLAWRSASGVPRLALLGTIIAAMGGGALLAVRQMFHGALLAVGGVSRGEFYGYSAAGLLVSALLLGWGVRAADRPMRIAGLALMTVTTLKVFLIDAAALDGLLRIASFLGLGVALIAIGWAYGRFLNPVGDTVTETS
jgi:uncharacterized membrane protein